MKYLYCTLENGSTILVPDVRIVIDCATYRYYPTRGFSASVAVKDTRGFIGWMSIDNLPNGPYKNVKEYLSIKSSIEKESLNECN